MRMVVCPRCCYQWCEGCWTAHHLGSVGQGYPALHMWHPPEIPEGTPAWHRSCIGQQDPGQLALPLDKLH